MTVTNVHKDTDTLTMTITSEFPASAERVWQIWADPRLLERWWGPPVYPATVVDHDFTPGGKVSYFMTGPTGDQHHGWWRVQSMTPPHALEFVDGFADEHGDENPALPVTSTRVTIDGLDSGGTRMSITTTFPSVEAMEQMVAMGMEEGMSLALGQVDALL